MITSSRFVAESKICSAIFREVGSAILQQPQGKKDVAGEMVAGKNGPSAEILSLAAGGGLHMKWDSFLLTCNFANEKNGSTFLRPIKSYSADFLFQNRITRTCVFAA